MSGRSQTQLQHLQHAGIVSSSRQDLQIPSADLIFLLACAGRALFWQTPALRPPARQSCGRQHTGLRAPLRHAHHGCHHGCHHDGHRCCHHDGHRCCHRPRRPADAGSCTEQGMAGPARRSRRRTGFLQPPASAGAFVCRTPPTQLTPQCRFFSLTPGNNVRSCVPTTCTRVEQYRRSFTCSGNSQPFFPLSFLSLP